MPENLPPFASDNYAPVHPEVMAAMAAANSGYATAYGDDPWGERLGARVRELFGDGARAFPVLNGTGANVVSLMAVSPRWGGVVVSDVAHVNTDENGAPERVGGLKLLSNRSVDARIAPADVERWAWQRDDVHRAHPGAVSITQSTELGTVYSLDELRALVDVAHAHGMAVHMDGSRLANAAASLGCSLHALTTDVGVDIVSLGAAKNGGMLGEAIVVLGPDDGPATDGFDAAAVRAAAATAVPFLRKATTQLASKARYVSAQLLALLGEPAGTTSVVEPVETTTALWLRNAAHANAMAARLRSGLEAAGVVTADAVPASGVRFTRPTQANAVFATLPRDAADRLRARANFYDWTVGETPDRVEARWMCAWDTAPENVDAFVAAVVEEVGRA